MKLTNPWVGYLQRSYKQIKLSVINRLKTIVPEITDHSESNILIIIVSMFSGLVEQINYYLDNNARESFLGTARKFSSVVKLVKILDYRIKSWLPASVDLYFTYLNSEGEPIEISQQAIIPAGTIVRTQNGTPFMVLKTVEVNIGDSYGKAIAKQQEKVEAEELGMTSNLPNQIFPIPGNYAHNSIELNIEGEIWTLKNTLARSLPSDKHFIVNVDEDKVANVQFGNGLKGAIPTANKKVFADYFITEGAYGNTISAGTINILDSELVLPEPSVGVSITNEFQPIAGSDVESIEDIRVNAPLTIRTLERAVTPQDFRDLVIQADGVAKGDVIYVCGKDLDIYIAPNGGGIATQALLEDTFDYMNELKSITTRINLKAAGVTPVVIKGTIQSRFRVDKVQTKLDADAAVGELFSFDNQEINGRVAISDIYGALEKLDKVDTVDITAVYTLPYPFPLNHLRPLSWERETLEGSNIKSTWKLVYTGTDFRLFRNEAFVSNIPLNYVYTDPDALIRFKLNPGMYTVGDVWGFTSYPFNKTIKVNDQTIPIVVGGQTTLFTVV